MKVCSFTIARNVIKYGYPVEESIRSILPICDKVYVAVGKSSDDTLNLIKSIDPGKIEIIETIWDETLRSGGRVLAVETNKAFDAVPPGYDWCIYLQADEVLHEKDHGTIVDAMKRWKDDAQTEGLLFKYLHFWGTFDYIGTSREWYRYEIRVIKNNKQIRSYRDAQGFRRNNEKLKVRKIDASVHHYGWVRQPEIIKEKRKNFSTLYHSGAALEKEIRDADFFDYSQVGAVKLYQGSHPAVMQERINNLNWKVNLDPRRINLSTKDRVLFLIERIFGYRLFEYRNYKVIKH